MNVSTIELVLVIAVLVVVFVVLMKYFKWALEGVVVFALVILGLYIALRVLDVSDPNGEFRGLLAEIKEKLGFNDPETNTEVKKLAEDVAETTKVEQYASKFNLKKIWEDIKAILKF